MKNIKIEIYNNGRDLFLQKGFKETNVSDITKLTGIGVGSFYNFYSSKEALFLEVFFRENMTLKKSIVESIDLEEEPVKVFKEVISKLFYGMNTNPILKEWFNRDAFNKIQEKLKVEELRKEFDEFSYNLFIEVIKHYQTRGSLRKDIDTDFILALFNSLSYIDLHKDEIGNQYFPQIIDNLVEYIVIGLKQN